MPSNNLSRRGFLNTSLAATCATGLPLWFAEEVVALEQEQAPRAVKSVNDKLHVGIIGCGDRVRSGDLLFALLDNPSVDVVACCDVDEKQLDYTCRLVASERNRRGAKLDAYRRPIPLATNPKRFGDFRDLIEKGGVDAVLVTTPDHWHALAAIAAAKAKKDIYCEKPLCLTIAEGRAMVKAVRANDVIFQTGSQQRSQLGKFRLACELVRNDRIGQLKKIETRIGNPDQGGPFKEEDPPEGLEWNFWLGQTPKVPFIKERCHYQFRWW
jgi:predicted dehydrogenase